METSQQQLQATHQGGSVSVSTIRILALLAVLVFAAVFLLGYLPRRTRVQTIQSEALAEQSSLPQVSVIRVKRAPPISQLSLPGNIQAITESPIIARADGYVARRYVDIGDRVATGKLLAEINAPDLDQQVRQAQANVQQARAAMAQAEAALEQAKANASLAEVTAQRNRTLVARGVLSKQEGDTSDANLLAQLANVRSVEANVAAARQNEDAARANLQRLLELQGYKQVRAPFDGVVTQRNIDTGYYINNGNTILFRMARYDVLRTFVNVPQASAVALRTGDRAEVTVTEMPGRFFEGRVSRLSEALDTTTRTLLTEVQLVNHDGVLRPGMYAQVQFSLNQEDSALTVPGDAIIANESGTEVAKVGPDSVVRFQKVVIGRDYGEEVEVLTGLKNGDNVIVNPSDAVQDGARVRAQLFREPRQEAASTHAGASVPSGASGVRPEGNAVPGRAR